MWICIGRKACEHVSFMANIVSIIILTKMKTVIGPEFTHSIIIN